MSSIDHFKEKNVQYSVKKAEFSWKNLNYFTLAFTWRFSRVKYKGEFTWRFIHDKYSEHLLDTKNASVIVWRKLKFSNYFTLALLDVLFRVKYSRDLLDGLLTSSIVQSLLDVVFASSMVNIYLTWKWRQV